MLFWTNYSVSAFRPTANQSLKIHMSVRAKACATRNSTQARAWCMVCTHTHIRRRRRSQTLTSTMAVIRVNWILLIHYVNGCQLLGNIEFMCTGKSSAWLLIYCIVPGEALWWAHFNSPPPIFTRRGHRTRVNAAAVRVYRVVHCTHKRPRISPSLYWFEWLWLRPQRLWGEGGGGPLWSLVDSIPVLNSLQWRMPLGNSTRRCLPDLLRVDQLP